MLTITQDKNFKFVGYQYFHYPIKNDFGTLIEYSISKVEIVECLHCEQMRYPRIGNQVKCNGETICKCLCKGE